MLNYALEILNSKSGIYYATINSSLILSFTDKKIQVYLEITESVKNEIITDFFPEIYGLEDEILNVIFKKTERFSLNTINRTLKNEIFFNLHFLSNPGKENSAFIIIEDVTEGCLSLRKLQQRKNEIILKNSELIRRKTLSEIVLLLWISIINYFRY